MNDDVTNRRLLLQSLAVLPAAALVLQPNTALAAASKVIVFKGGAFVAGGKIEVQTLPIRLSPTPTICSVSPWTAGKGRRRRIEEAIRLILDCSENRTGV